MNSRRQFEIAECLAVFPAVAGIAVFVQSPGSVTFAVAEIVLCVVGAWYFRKNDASIPLVSTLVGVAWVAIVLASMAIITIVQAPRVQGQLYIEDGPLAFLLVLSVLLLIGTIVCGVLGYVVGLVIRLGLHVYSVLKR